MVKEFALTRRAAAFAAAASLVVASMAPLLLGQMRVEAAQMTERQIRITSSKVSQTGVTYNVSFKPSATTVIRGLVVEICQNSPLAGATCTTTNGVSATPTTGTITFTNAGSTGDATFEVHANSTAAGRLILTDADGATGGDGITPVTTANFTFFFTATNPSGTASTAGDPGTFYARILTYGVAATASAYTSTAPGTHIDDGGVALSTADQLTINARVQEQLEFCVASIADTIVSNATAPANCQDTAFTGASNDNTVDLGVVDSGTPSVSPVSATTGGDTQNGGIMIRTNAFYGAVVSYYAEQNTSSGSLKVSGATCGSTVIGTGSTTDQCFNSAGTTQANFQTGAGGAGEKFGMTAGKVLRPTGSTTTNLTRSTDYDGNGTATATACTAATADSDSCFAWVDTAPAANTPATTIASSTTVLDYEMLVLNFAARAAATTPTGSYAVTSTYIATSTF